MQTMSQQRRREFLLEGTRTGHLGTSRRDGSAHVAPIWFTLDGDDVLFMTGADTVKGRSLRRDPRATLSVDDPAPPYAFVTVTGRCQLSEDLAEMYRWALLISNRYMGVRLRNRRRGRSRAPVCVLRLARSCRGRAGGCGAFFRLGKLQRSRHAYSSIDDHGIQVRAGFGHGALAEQDTRSTSAATRPRLAWRHRAARRLPPPMARSLCGTHLEGRAGRPRTRRLTRWAPS